MPSPAMGGKKEPEDIFSSINLGSEASSAPSLPPPVVAAASGGSSLKLVLIVLGVVVVLGGGGFATWYFVFDKTAAEPASMEAPVAQAPVAQAPVASPQGQPQTADPLVETPPPEAMPGPVDAPSPVTTPPPGVNIPLPDAAPPAPSAPPSEGIDGDGDGLTDVEEGIIGSDPANTDTDGDGYGDGIELRGLYSPLGKGVGLNAVTTLKRVTLRDMSFLLPDRWTLGPAANDPTSIFVETGGLARWKVTATDVGAEQAMAAVTAARSSGATAVTAKSGIEGALADGGLAMTFAVDGMLVTVAYEANGASSYEHRALFDLMFRSLTKVTP